MWFGKIAIILWLFSIFSLFFGYYLNTIFNDPTLTASPDANYLAMKTLADSFKLNQQVNTSLIFGDFIAGATVLFGLISGSTVTAMLTMGIPQFDVSMQLAFELLWASSNIFLWVYIIANRSV